MYVNHAPHVAVNRCYLQPRNSNWMDVHLRRISNCASNSSNAANSSCPTSATPISAVHKIFLTTKTTSSTPSTRLSVRPRSVSNFSDKNWTAFYRACGDLPPPATPPQLRALVIRGNCHAIARYLVSAVANNNACFSVLAKGVVLHAGTPLKRVTEPGPPDAGSARKRSRANACNTSSQGPQGRASAGASATSYGRVAGIIKMQPPSQSRECASTKADPTNPFHDPTFSSFTADLPTHVFSPPFSPFNYNDVNIAAIPQLQQQHKPTRAAPAVSRALANMSDKSSQAKSSPESPLTLAPSESSISPGPTRRQNVSRTTEEPNSHSCEKCTKVFPRPCDLK